MKKGYLASLALIPLLLFCAQKPSDQSEVPQADSAEDVLAELKALHQLPDLKNASIGAYVVDTETGNVLLQYNATQSLATASTMKSLTTATALQVLGNDFKFETQIAFTGRQEGHTVNGDLYIVGSGDPTLGSENFEAVLDGWVKKVQERGIKHITGKLIGDASIFEFNTVPERWIWQDIGNYYGAGPCGLSINDNLYKIYLQSGATGSATKILRVEPQIEGLTFVNEVKAGAQGTGDNAYIYGAPYTYERYMRGTIPPNQQEFVVKGSLPDPAKFCTELFYKKLKKAGVHVSGFEVNYDPKNAYKQGTVLHAEASATLLDICTVTNIKSVNLNAETLLKLIGFRLAKDGSTLGGAEALKQYWQAKGIDMSGFFMEDGSGLTRHNAVTAKQMAEILQYTRKSGIGEAFENTLPIAGQTGTLKSIGKGTPAEGRIHAKSGYIARVRGYAGFAETLSGRKLTFVILINNYGGTFAATTGYFERFFNQLVKTD